MNASVRQRLLTCDICFAGPEGGSCRHHEDVVGGYAPERIVVVGINPQSPAKPAPGTAYEIIEAGSWQEKMAFSDHVLESFAGRSVRRVFADPAYDAHPGLRQWLPRFCKYFAVAPAEVADKMRFVETYKHATPDESTLRKLPQFRTIDATCPRTWLARQLEALRPRALVFAGGSAVDAGRAHLALTPNRQQLGMTELHGMVGAATVGNARVDALLSIGVSRQNPGRWNAALGTNLVRQRLRAWLNAMS